jgi:bifunctional ADP-heptose synthase (sugar kinase/adenylyltransferase)
MEEFEDTTDESLLNLKVLTNAELRTHLDELYAEEQQISYRRRVLHGRIDILRAELVRRLAQAHREGGDVISGADIDKLIRILANDLRPAGAEPPHGDTDSEE